MKDNFEIKLTKIIKQISFIFANVEISKQIYLPPEQETISENEFNGFEIREITIPSSIKTIEKSVYADCFLLPQIIIPSSVEFIDENAFYGCFDLNQITIDPYSTKIHKNALKSARILIA